MYLPACLISQMGVCGTGSRRQARIKGLLFSAAVESDSGFRIKLVSFSCLGFRTFLNFAAESSVQLAVEIELQFFCYRSTQLVQDLIQTTIYRLKAGSAVSLKKLS
jgi:hypothetical protein